MFSSAKQAGKTNVKFLAVLNKEIMCAWCIQSVNCNNMGMVDAFSSYNDRKRQTKHI